jgi:hypothetical protein
MLTDFEGTVELAAQTMAIPVVEIERRTAAQHDRCCALAVHLDAKLLRDREWKRAPHLRQTAHAKPSRPRRPCPRCPCSHRQCRIRRQLEAE